jgi:chromosome segregation ATPase
VAVYGGGTWPRFKTVADNSIAIVQKLPCFGCNWKCHYATAPCIEAISVEKVTPLLSEIIEYRSIQERREVDIQEFSDASIDIIRNGAFTVQNLRIESSALCLQVATLTDQLKESELDRGLRFEQIQELTDQLKESELDRGLRFEQIQELTELLKESEADRAERLKRIHQLETRLDSVVRRLDRVERTYRALESTFVVRKARLLRLISVGCISDPPEYGEKAIL